MESRHPWSEQEFIEQLKGGQVDFPPASLAYFPIPEDLRLDGGMSVTWFDRTADFAFEYKVLSTPKTIDEATRRAIDRLKGQELLLPMIVVPYLSEDALKTLQNRLVSGLDLCGNGVVIAPGKFWLRNAGGANQFKSSLPLRNVFRGTSSLVGRCLLLKESFETLAELQEFAVSLMPVAFREREDTILSKGTVSKVVQILEEERIVTREKTRVRLKSRERLLDNLESNHRKGHGRTVLGKSPFAPEKVWSELADSQMLHVATGVGSASRYGLISGLERQQLYVEDLPKAMSLLEMNPTRLFPTLELIEEKSPVPYFDARVIGEESLASPIQTWLELSAGEPRERVAAQQLRSSIRLKEVS